jgi:hypothetical protein
MVKSGCRHRRRNRKEQNAGRRYQTKDSKEQKVEGVAVVEGTDIKPEFKKLIEEVESGEKPTTAKKAKKEKKARVRSKRYIEAASLVDKTKTYPLTDAVSLVKKTSLTKFDGSVELHINLNPASLGEKKDMRGSVSLPHGTGKQVRVLIADETIIADVAEGKSIYSCCAPKHDAQARQSRPYFGTQDSCPATGTVWRIQPSSPRTFDRQGKLQSRTRPARLIHYWWVSR